MKKILKVSTLAALTAGVLLSACGGGDDNNPAMVSGVFLDAAVEGLDYVATGAGKASTGANGEFTCTVGNTLSFTLGGIALGSAPCNATVTPLTLAGSSNVKDDSVVNRLLALQLLDEDNDPSNGIKLSAAVKAALANRTLDFNASAATFNTAMTATLASLPVAYQGRSVDRIAAPVANILKTPPCGPRRRRKP